MSAGKGDKPRPVNKTMYDKNFDLIKKNTNEIKNVNTLKKKGKIIYVYK